MKMKGANSQPRFYAVRLVQQREKKGEEMWTADNPELLGCHVVRKSAQAAMDDLVGAREEWLGRARAAGEEIPEPSEHLTYHLVLAPDHTEEEAKEAMRAIAATTGRDVSTQTAEMAFS
jgi:predicted RNase H-like HicB family nuclease